MLKYLIWVPGLFWLYYFYIDHQLDDIMAGRSTYEHLKTFSTIHGAYSGIQLGLLALGGLFYALPCVL